MKSTTTMNLREILSDNAFVGLFRLMRDYRLLYLGATMSLGIAAAARSGTYLLLGRFVDNIMAGTLRTQKLPWLALGFIGLAVVTGAFTFVSGALAARTSESIAQRLRDFIFDHIQRLTFSYHDQTKTGDLIQRATSDIEAVRNFFAAQAIGIGRIVLLFIVNLVVLLMLNWKLALYSIIIVPFTIAFSIYFFSRVSKAYESYQEQDAVLSSMLQENLTAFVWSRLLHVNPMNVINSKSKTGRNFCVDVVC